MWADLRQSPEYRWRSRVRIFRPFIPSVAGIGLLCNVYAEGPVSFMNFLQRSPTGLLIPLDGSVSFCEKGDNLMSLFRPSSMQ